MKSNPPIRGHELIREGGVRRVRLLDGTEKTVGGCRCGALPPGFDMSVAPNAVKRWHRQHKEEIRAAAKGDERKG